MTDSLNWKELFKSHELFRELKAPQLNKLLRNSNERIYEANAVILEEGDIDDAIYVMGDGEASVNITRRDKTQLTIGNLKKNDMFGEMAFFEKKPRSATIVASNRCVVREIKADNFTEILKSNPLFDFKVMVTMSERLRRVTEHVLQVQLRDLGEKFDALKSEIDVEHKIFDNAIKTTRAHFEATNDRVKDLTDQTAAVIEKHQLHQGTFSTTIKWFTGILSSIIFFLGFFGYKSLNDLADTTNKKVDEITHSLQEFDRQEKKIRIISDKLNMNYNKATVMLDNMAAHKEYFEPRYWRYIGINNILEEELEGKAYGASDTLYHLLSLKDPIVTKAVFVMIMQRIIEQPEHRDRMIWILERNIVKLYGPEKFMCFYFALAAYHLSFAHSISSGASEDDIDYDEKYNSLKSELEEYRKDYSGEGVRGKETYKDFDPDEFINSIAGHSFQAKTTPKSAVSDAGGTGMEPRKHAASLTREEVNRLYMEAHNEAEKHRSVLKEIWNLLPEWENRS